MSVRLTPRLTKAARALAGWDVDDLARQAGVDRSRLVAFEAQPEAFGAAEANVALVQAFERAGVTFLVEAGTGVGVRRRTGAGATGSLPIDQLNASNDE